MDLNVAVNLAPENLQDGPLLKTVMDLLARSDTLPEWLTVEVTETAMMADPVRIRTVLTRLHDLGVRLSIDDFGTGYSSLAYLKDLPVDEVKVDRSFVKDLTVNARNACIVRAVIDLGHDLGLRVVPKEWRTGRAWTSWPPGSVTWPRGTISAVRSLPLTS